MQCPWDEVMTEAFRRAQMAGRVFPQLCDFPSSVPGDVVQLTYLKPLRALNGDDRGGAPMHAAPLLCGPLEVTGFFDPMEDEEESLLMTYGGDAWASALFVASHTRSGGGYYNGVR
ncbi:hypothetical protein LPMP_302580 [Leishmania panamensis]|uniref:Uncharacterized protein n=3 Tax=Leishmania guyanensis species complex TaxID=38579 RepID=A0A088RX03_LEIPA|nr:hypothetical protein LPMP_302580 [Leishmania panamensis]AIO00481.1 hypothetical protein LPMP_302580 [Leishmania panamensis]CCM17672.1 hypothetical protein, conserved [Leishmania guyanensis]